MFQAVTMLHISFSQCVKISGSLPFRTQQLNTDITHGTSKSILNMRFTDILHVASCIFISFCFFLDLQVNLHSYIVVLNIHQKTIWISPGFLFSCVLFMLPVRSGGRPFDLTRIPTESPPSIEYLRCHGAAGAAGAAAQPMRRWLTGPNTQ